MPAALNHPAGLFTRKLYDEAQAYSVDKWWFGFWHGLYNLVETVLWLQVCQAVSGRKVHMFLRQQYIPDLQRVQPAAIH
jgi:hypothetical protein